MHKSLTLRIYAKKVNLSIEKGSILKATAFKTESVKNEPFNIANLPNSVLFKIKA